VLFGAEVLAVTAGRIVSMRNDLAENTPPNSPPIPPQNPDLAAGNYVVEALGSGRFALYAHLQPGSVRVSPGQTVQRGQVLGLVGNTGSSSEPHLHFHVMNRPSPLAANGLPYVFDRFRLDGRVPNLRAPRLVPAGPPHARAGQLPLQGDVVAFP
jgi:murein DD-endopeptidase MepM/ murein hydrolase activator NlpD